VTKNAGRGVYVGKYSPPSFTDGKKYRPMLIGEEEREGEEIGKIKFKMGTKKPKKGYR
jgi:hypothetical protein